MKMKILAIFSLVVMMALSSCTLSLLRPTPTPTPTVTPLPTTIPSPTLMVASPTFTNSVPAVLPTLTPTLTSAAPLPATATRTPTTSVPVILPGSPSGPYGVILVTTGDVLNIRSGPGVAYPVASSFTATDTTVMRTGPSSTVGGVLWVEVNKPGGGTGWVNSNFLTEYVVPATFCGTASVNTLITNLDTALTTDNGVLLSSLVSPRHGMSVYLWRYGNHVTFMPDDARWVFGSTFQHDWGAAPGSGLDTVGSFHISVLPYLKEVFNASYTLTCNSLGTAPSYGGQPWPLLYTNVNYYTVYKPGTPGVDLDFRFFLVGVEFVSGQPTVFALIHFAWEP